MGRWVGVGGWWVGVGVGGFWVGVGGCAVCFRFGVCG